MEEIKMNKNLLNAMVEYHLDIHDPYSHLEKRLERIERLTNFCNKRDKKKLLELILKKMISSGNTEESLRISEKIGRKLTNKEKMGLFLINPKKEVVDLFQEPKRSQLLIKLNKNCNRSYFASQIANTTGKKRVFWLNKCISNAWQFDDIKNIFSLLDLEVNYNKIILRGLELGDRSGYYFLRDCKNYYGRKITKEEFEIYLKSSLKKYQAITKDIVDCLDFCVEGEKTELFEKLLLIHLDNLKEGKIEKGRITAHESFNIAISIPEKIGRNLNLSELRILLQWEIACGSLWISKEVVELMGRSLKDSELEKILTEQLKTHYTKWGSNFHYKTDSILETINFLSEDKKTFYLELLK